MPALTLSVVVPSYGRDQVLLDTLDHHLNLTGKTEGFIELIVVDQTSQHDSVTEQRLTEWNATGAIHWIRLPEPNLTGAMNIGLKKAQGDIVLFTDDDITPNSDLLNEHLAAHIRHPEVWAVVGQILQPGEEPENIPFVPTGGHLTRYLDFPFRRTEGTYIEQAMAGNLSVRREKALQLGGFDENFTPPVASRFETEFAKRIIEVGGTIWFEPAASIRHLRAATGGTRSKGSHLTSISPCHSVGDYYYALVRGQGWEKWWYILKRPFRQVRTKFHFRNPWWIPPKLIAELTALVQSLWITYRSKTR